MCRHLAYLGPSRSLASLLHDADHSLAAQSQHPRHQEPGATNADGWGVGWWDRSQRAEPALFRSAAPIWADRSFRSVAGLTRSTAIVAAARRATPPLPIVASGNAPFASGPWLFSLNGFVSEFGSRIGDQLHRTVSPSRAAGIDRDHDSQVLFAMVLDRLDHGASSAAAMGSVIAQVLADGEGKLNLLLSDGHAIVATTWRNSLFSLADSGVATGGVLLASEPLDDDTAWTLIPDGSLVEASGTTVTVTPLLPHRGSA
ncbi:MAG: ergothioneine biosynthesis protein EgtC [Acidimicrobiales bacterium]